MDTKTLINQVQGAFKGIAVQFAAQNLLQPHKLEINGSAVYNMDRLKVKELSSITMAICLIIVSLIALSMFALRPWDVVPREPNSIFGVAAILKSSKDLKTLLANSLAVNRTDLSEVLISSLISKEAAHSFTIFATENRTAPRQSDNQKRSPEPTTEWWRPLSLQPWARLGTLIVTLAIICGLEVFQRVSDHHHGLTTVSHSNRDSGRYASVYIPSLMLMGVSALYSSLSFNITLLSPYRAMRDRPCKSERCIQSNYLGRWPIYQVFQSIRRRHIAAFCTSLASIIAGFFTIAVSGLYTLTPMETSTEVALSHLDRFKTSWVGNNYADECAAGVLGFMMWQNLSYPAWTYDDLAFPSFVLNSTISVEQSQKRVSAVIPAKRAVLKCDLANLQKTVIREDLSTTGSHGLWIESEMASTCAEKGSDTTFTHNFRGPMPQSFGAALTQLDNSTGNLNSTTMSNVPNKFQTNRAAGCSSLAFYFGSFGPPPTYQPADITAFICTQHVQEVSTVVNFLLPGLEIDTSSPPAPNESTVRYLTNDHANGSDVFDYPVAFPISSAFIPAQKGSTFSVPGVDNFYTAIMYGKDGVPARELAGRKNAPRLITATKKLYSRYMAQVLSLKMREKLGAGDNGLPQIRGVVRSEELRLVQNGGPKIALQVMLAVMFVCGAVSWMTMRTSQLITHDPCSIAGIATLLVGSNLWKGSAPGRTIPTMSDEETEEVEDQCSGSSTQVPYDELGMREDSDGHSNIGSAGYFASDIVLGASTTHRQDNEQGNHLEDTEQFGHGPEDTDMHQPQQNRVSRELNISREGGMQRNDFFPEGAEWMDDAELAQSGVLDGKLFNLTWWPDGRFGIDVVTAD